jgi:hypothetical protein
MSIVDGIGQLNRVVIIEVWEYAQDDAGGTTGTVVETWQQRASVIDRSGMTGGNSPLKFGRVSGAGGSDNNAQPQTSYMTKMIVRFLRPISTVNTLLYEGARYVIEEVNVDTQGHKDFYILRCSKTETWVGIS